MYAYCSNNPLNRVDPSGLAAQQCAFYMGNGECSDCCDSTYAAMHPEECGGEFTMETFFLIMDAAKWKGNLCGSAAELEERYNACIGRVNDAFNALSQNIKKLIIAAASVGAMVMMIAGVAYVGGLFATKAIAEAAMRIAIRKAIGTVIKEMGVLGFAGLMAGLAGLLADYALASRKKKATDYCDDMKSWCSSKTLDDVNQRPMPPGDMDYWTGLSGPPELFKDYYQQCLRERSFNPAT